MPWNIVYKGSLKIYRDAQHFQNATENDLFWPTKTKGNYTYLEKF